MMAKYTAEYECGHSDTVRLFGPPVDRHRKLEWLRTRLCPRCFGEQRRAESAAAGPQFYMTIPDHKDPRNRSLDLERVQLVCWSESFGIKDQLKEREWRFEEMIETALGRSEHGDMFSTLSDYQRHRPGWSITFKRADVELITAEMAWIESNGWPVVMAIPPSVTEIVLGAFVAFGLTD